MVEIFTVEMIQLQRQVKTRLTLIQLDLLKLLYVMKDQTNQEVVTVVDSQTQAKVVMDPIKLMAEESI
jgi:hypothetical protein